jgi:hypothetical protein
MSMLRLCFFVQINKCLNRYPDSFFNKVTVNIIDNQEIYSLQPPIRALQTRMMILFVII